MKLISRKLCRLLLKLRLALFHSVSYFFFLYRSPSSSLRTVFDSVPSNIDEVLSINLSANMFGKFNVHHKDWFTYSGGTDRSGDFCFNFKISNDLTQMLNFPTQIQNCDSHSSTVLNLFLSSDASICSTLVFLHWKILIMLVSQFPLAFHHFHNGLIHFIALLMTLLVLIGSVFVIIWKMFHGRIYLNSALLLLLVNFTGGFRLEWMYISLIVSIRSSLSHFHGFQLFVQLL